MMKLNLGCGPVFVDSPDWMNLDFNPVSPAVQKANLLQRLPLPDKSVDLVYSSHFLEHVPKSQVADVLRECWRVLLPGGTVRLVLPDLNNMAREYLQRRDAGEHDKADFVVLELVDQCVRRESGGELGLFYQAIRDQANAQEYGMIGYVHERVGEDLSRCCGGGRRRSLWTKLRGGVERGWVRLCLSALPAAFRAQNVSLAAVGERHHWLWDFHQLKTLLEATGFVDVQRRSAHSSALADFPFQPLDLDAENRPRKGAESMFVEAIKPLKH